MNEKMNTKKGKETYKLRAITVEPAFGDIKENKGIRGFLTRGMETVKTEFDLVCTAINLKKIWIDLQKKNNIMKNIIIKNPNAFNAIYLYSYLA
jgi:transposase